MSVRADFHVHTTFCDGAATPREMAEAARSAGLTALGFSGHSFVEFDPSCGMNAETAGRYRVEIHALRKEYAEALPIFSGIEKDVYGEADTAPYDYVIGSGHYVPLPGGGFSPVDVSPETTISAIREHFSGDAFRYAAAYYEGLAVRLLTEPRVDIVGHFDLIAKFNEGGRLFDERNPRYQSAALDALEAVAKVHPRFEINTGAMSRGWRSAPYPAPFLLKRLKELSGRIVLSSDSHSAAALLYGFREAAELAKASWFAEADLFSEHGFYAVKL
ncbi:MAG: histidinol phosphate phosphatase [Clostridia bacterium]|jgi:histidinol-phosphatase (PHP family)|nr:MAG: histidinol phosphate phosphatase [Clostridia bacterium]